MSAERSEHKIDRAKWPAGPWDSEPDRVEWRDPLTGLPCLIVRGDHGALCGYVAIPPGHPFRGEQSSEIDNLQAHGGITYTDKCQPDGPICHVPLPGESDDVLWVGFDCIHLGDISPGHYQYAGGERRPGEYRTVEYVRAWCKTLAAQIALGVGAAS